jgi:hypothetical protein
MINLLFFISILSTLLYLLDVLCFFTKKQPLLFIKKWILLLATLIISLLWTFMYYQSSKDVIRIQSDMIQDFNNDNIHDSTCNCGYCTEINADYYLNLGIMDTLGNYGIYLIRPENNDTIANLSNSELLKTVINNDNL